MKKLPILAIILMTMTQPAVARDCAVCINAFGETATAYINDAFLLIGTTADGYVADIMKKDTALEIVKNVQKRVRIVRSKIKDVSRCRISESDRRLMGLLDEAYACLDHLTWALTEYVQDKTPESTRRFDQQRGNCMLRLEAVGRFYTSLPPSPELPEPLSTR
jgi:hypothetical protein